MLFPEDDGSAAIATAGRATRNGKYSSRSGDASTKAASMSDEDRVPGTVLLPVDDSGLHSQWELARTVRFASEFSALGAPAIRDLANHTYTVPKSHKILAGIPLVSKPRPKAKKRQASRRKAQPQTTKKAKTAGKSDGSAISSASNGEDADGNIASTGAHDDRNHSKFEDSNLDDGDLSGSEDEIEELGLSADVSGQGNSLLNLSASASVSSGGVDGAGAGAGVEGLAQLPTTHMAVVSKGLLSKIKRRMQFESDVLSALGACIRKPHRTPDEDEALRTVLSMQPLGQTIALEHDVPGGLDGPTALMGSDLVIDVTGKAVAHTKPMDTGAATGTS